MYTDVPSGIPTGDPRVLCSMNLAACGHINGRRVVCQIILITSHAPVNARLTIKLYRYSTASIATISTDNPSIDPIIHGVAREGYNAITVSLNIHAMDLTSSLRAS
jgi:hypothetical protein